MNDSSGKSAIILSGGGAYGAYEIGVMRALFNGDTNRVVRRLELRDLNAADEINLVHLAAALRVRQASGWALELGLP